MSVEQINNSTEKATYLHHDQAGSTRLITSSAGTVEGAYTYTPYGGTEAHTGTATTPLGYDGQYTSPDTGLIYLRARTYDPTTAQFMSVDPAVEVTRQPYIYAEDNPLSGGDSTGLCNGNPFSESFWTRGNCVSEDLNPISYYENEIAAYENGCGYFASVAFGIEGAFVGINGSLPRRGPGVEGGSMVGGEIPRSDCEAHELGRARWSRKSRTTGMVFCS